MRPWLTAAHLGAQVRLHKSVEFPVEIAREKAGLASARVVEYVQPFGLANLLGLSTKTERLLDLGPDTLAELASPRIMVLWTGR